MTEDEMTILLVDDDAIDRSVVVRNFRRARNVSRIVEARDGIEALDVLRGKVPGKEISAPFLILLDLRMPRMDGVEFLRAIRSDSVLSVSIIFILTTSSADDDRIACYREQVAGYIVKSHFTDDFWRIVQMLSDFSKIIEFP